MPARKAWKKEPEKDKKRKVKVCGFRGGSAILWTTIQLCLRVCPWYFECVVMYVRHERCRFIVTGTEAKLLGKLLTSWIVLLQSSSDSFDSVQEPGRRIEVLLEKAALYFYCESSGVLLGTQEVVPWFH